MGTRPHNLLRALGLLPAKQIIYFFLQQSLHEPLDLSSGVR